ESFTETMSYLWGNSQPFFWVQLLIPLAALILAARCCSCCIPFLIGCWRLPLEGRRLRTCDHCSQRASNTV
nr:transframe fusion protein [Whataroa virus]